MEMNLSRYTEFMNEIRVGSTRILEIDVLSAIDENLDCVTSTIIELKSSSPSNSFSHADHEGCQYYESRD